jgi:HTH-type transcriptional repressor of NAD biosynthesis genes
VKNQFPDANVVHHYALIPQDPSEHPDFWNIWKESIERHCPGEEFDALFGSEDYGWKMAHVMGIEYIPVDRIRDLVPISGTAMRTDPMRNWEYLPVVVRPYFAKRVAIVGPESSGKSTLAKNLAEYYHTAFVADYKRSLLKEYATHKEYHPGEIQEEDISTIARGQIVTEDSLVKRANRVIFSDTELSSIVLWAMSHFNYCPPWIVREAEKRMYDLYLLLEPDVLESKAEERKAVAAWEELLKNKGAQYLKVGGTHNESFSKAIRVVDQLIKAGSYSAVKFAILAVDIVLFSIQEGELKVLLVKVNRPPHFVDVPGFPGGVIDPSETAEETAIRQLKNKGGVDLDNVYIEQLATFSDPARDPRGRVVSTAFLGLTNRSNLVPESQAYWYPVNKISEMAYDHKLILDQALARLRSKIEHTDLATRLLPEGFSGAELQNVHEIILGKKYS